VRLGLDSAASTVDSGHGAGASGDGRSAARGSASSRLKTGSLTMKTARLDRSALRPTDSTRMKRWAITHDFSCERGMPRQRQHCRHVTPFPLSQSKLQAAPRYLGEDGAAIASAGAAGERPMGSANGGAPTCRQPARPTALSADAIWRRQTGGARD